jgi:hypothetical protein
MILLWVVSVSILAAGLTMALALLYVIIRAYFRH